MLWLYRGADGFRWRRRTATGALVATAISGWGWKVSMWRDCRRMNPDWQSCRIDDRTFTWTRHNGGGTNLSRPAGARTPREHLPLRELRRRL